MSQDAYDAIVIGSGPAGSAAASTLAEQGQRVAQIERGRLGGTCLNVGCDPTKTLIYTARLLHLAQRAGDWGVRARDVGADWESVLARVQRIITTLRGGTNEEARADLASKGIEVISGFAQFRSPHEVAVGQRVVSAPHICICTGGHAIAPPIPGLHEAGFVTHVEAVDLHPLPSRMAILGGATQGLEFAQLFARFGVAVTVLERDPSLLDKEDPELARLLCDQLRHEGVRLEAGTEVRRVERSGDIRRLILRQSQSDETLQVDQILITAGRAPNLEDLALDAAGVKTEHHGIVVDATLRTSVPHIWAAGDVADSLPFTHVAHAQGQLVGRNALAAMPQAFTTQAVPWVTFTDPELAHVGQTEEELRKQGISYQTRRLSFTNVERAVMNGETAGMVKLLIADDGHIVGGHILGAHAGELIAPVVLAMRHGLTADQIAATILPYPTLAEGVRWATAVQP